MTAVLWYLAGLGTVPALGLLGAVYFRTEAFFKARGWFLHRGVYDLKLDARKPWLPGEWALWSCGPLHVGVWIRSGVYGRWVAIGKRQGHRGWLGVTIGRSTQERAA